MPDASGPGGLPDIQSMWDYNDPAATEARLREVLPRAEASGDREYHAELLTQVARTYGLRGRFAEALALLDEVDATVTADMTRAQVRSLVERGRTLNSSGESAAALPRFIEAWEVGRSNGLDGLAVDAAHMVAIVETPDAALEWNQRALDLANSSSDPDARRWNGSLCNNLGWTYHSKGEFEKAHEYFEQAHDHRIEQGKPEEIRIARWCFARCLRSLGRVEEALAIQRELEAEMARGTRSDGYVDEEIAECLHALGRTDEAKPYFHREHDLLSQDVGLVQNEAERIERLRRLGHPD